MKERDLIKQASPLTSVLNSRTLLWLVILIAACTRLPGLGNQSLWMDELLTFNEANILATEGFLQLFSRNHVSPLYDVIVAVLLKFGLDSEFWLRLPSAIVGIISVPVSYLLVIRLFNHQQTALATAFLVAISPFAIWYAQEARGYSLLLLFSMLIVYLAWPALNRQLTLKEQLGLSLCTVVGFLSHPYIVMTAGSFGLFLLAHNGIRDKAFWGWVRVQIIAAIVLLPWFIIIFGGDSPVSAGSAKPQIGLWIPYTLFTFVGGFSLGPTLAELRSPNYAQALFAYLPLLVIASGASIAAFYIGFRHALSRNRLATLWCLTWLFVPMLWVILISLTSNINYNVRYVIASYPAIAIVVGGALVTLSYNLRSWIPISSVAVLLFVTLWSLSNWYSDPRYAKTDLRSAASWLSEVKQRDAQSGYWIASHGIVCSFLPYYKVSCPQSTVIVDSDEATLDQAINGLQQLYNGDEHTVYLLEYRTIERGPTSVLRTEIEKRLILSERYSWGSDLSVSRYYAEKQ